MNVVINLGTISLSVEILMYCIAALVGVSGAVKVGEYLDRGEGGNHA